MNAAACWLNFRLGARKAWAEPAFLVGSLGILVALVLSYGAVLKALPEDQLAQLNLTHGRMIWYLILTESVTVGTGFQYREMQEDIRSGAIEIMLLRPIAFWPMKLAEWAGQQVVKFGMTLPLALLMGLLLTGEFIPLPMVLVFVPVYAATMLMIFASFLAIGCTCLWVGESRPVFIIYQKLMFVLGGLLWPLVFYPAWLSHIAWLTPFAAITAVPGDLALDTPLPERLREFGAQAFWLVALLAVCASMAGAVRRRIMVRGG
jgi:ABC-2 type transport system permease protein